ncbi:MAG: nitroreductase family protein, partial [Coprothermobacterota bacterium]|nr:nitroreductase family protein [Coprothermobacterota bacterium]
MEMEEAIRTRRSVRSFKERDIPQEEVQDLLRLASWAPSGNNLQAWFFVAIHSPEVRESVAKAIEEKLAEIRNWP